MTTETDSPPSDPTEAQQGSGGDCVSRLVRRGWRTFLCDECGHHYEAATRDAMSPSGDTCPECNEVNFPAEYRIDAELPCDDYGNLREYLINVFPTNAKSAGTDASEKTL